jgi:hypothetical protein
MVATGIEVIPQSIAIMLMYAAFDLLSALLPVSDCPVWLCQTAKQGLDGQSIGNNAAFAAVCLENMQGSRSQKLTSNRNEKKLLGYFPCGIAFNPRKTQPIPDSCWDHHYGPTPVVKQKDFCHPSLIAKITGPRNAICGKCSTAIDNVQGKFARSNV